MYFTIGQLIPLDETVKWTVHNVPELLANNAWTAVSIPMEVGFGATMLSKWTISLHANAEVLHVTARLLEPTGHRVTHHLTLKIIRHGRPSRILTECQKGKTAHAGGSPSYWKIVSLEDLRDETAGIVTSEGTMQLIITLTVFGSDLSTIPSQ
jgi:hypothetical protein